MPMLSKHTAVEGVIVPLYTFQRLLAAPMQRSTLPSSWERNTVLARVQIKPGVEPSVELNLQASLSIFELLHKAAL